jgi:hypothetical protein
MSSPKLSTGLIIALAATGLFLSLVTAGIIATQNIASNGTITTVNVGVFSNEDCDQNCTAISWGTLYPGNSTSRTIYVKNTGTTPITLSMTTDNWQPTDASQYLTVTWTPQDDTLNPGESTSATLTLTADQDTGDITAFNFNIIITGAE